jgi:hypothetical protein
MGLFVLFGIGTAEAGSRRRERLSVEVRGDGLGPLSHFTSQMNQSNWKAGPSAYLLVTTVYLADGYLIKISGEAVTDTIPKDRDLARE